MAGQYYSTGYDAETQWGFGLYSGGLLSYFLGFDILTSGDTGVLNTFSSYSAAEVTGFFLNGSQLYSYKLENIKRAIYTFSSILNRASNSTYANPYSYPIVVYLQALGKGGDGGYDGTVDVTSYGGGGGGGSGYNSIGFVVLQPGDSLSFSISVTASQTTVVATLSTSSLAYTNINGSRYVSNTGTMTLVAGAGTPGGTNTGGGGYRKGGNHGAVGSSVGVGAETLEGYATQSYNPGGSAHSNPFGGGGGGAALCMLGYSTTLGKGGDGAWFNGYTAVAATVPDYGAGGGGNANYLYSGSYHYAAQSAGGSGLLNIYRY